MNKDILNKVLTILNTNIENVCITNEQIEDDLSKLGLDSIAFIRVIVEIEEEFRVEIPDEKLLLSEMNTISKIIEVIASLLKVSYETSSID